MIYSAHLYAVLMRERYTPQRILIKERPERWAKVEKMDPLAARVLENESERSLKGSKERQERHIRGEWLPGTAKYRKPQAIAPQARKLARKAV